MSTRALHVARLMVRSALDQLSETIAQLQSLERTLTRDIEEENSAKAKEPA